MGFGVGGEGLHARKVELWIGEHDGVVVENRKSYGVI